MPMKSALLLAVFVLAVVSALDQLSSIESCNRVCEKNYDRDEEDACKRGCSSADAIEAVPVASTNANTCNESCVSNYPDRLAMVNACEYGCNAYTSTAIGDPESLMGTILNLFSKLHGSSPDFPEPPTGTGLMLPINQNDSETPSDTNPVRVMVIRRFRIRLPNEDEGEGEAEQDPMFDSPMSPGMMHGPFGALMHMGNDQAAEDLAEPPMMPHAVMLRVKEPTIQEHMSDAARYMGSHPMIIVFTVTLFILCILLVVQLSLECKRRRRRSNPFQFEQLPTYVEATTVKIPVDSDLQDGPKGKTSDA